MGYAIEIVGLKKTYRSGVRRRSVTALNGLDLCVNRNEIFGFLGPNGAGKTTTLKILLGLLFPTAGSARVLGKPVGDLSVKAKVGFLPENPYFYEYLTCRELLDFYCRLFSIQKSERGKRIDRLLARVSLDHVANRQVRKLSHGMLQRLGIAQSLINDPEVLFLDEPMAGLDPVGRRTIREMIHELKAEGKTIFFSSHILQDAELLCDHVGILREGRLVNTGTLQEMLTPKLASYEAVVTDIPEDAIEELSHIATKLEKREERFHLLINGTENLRRMERIVAQSGGLMDSLSKTRGTLEDHFIEFIEREQDGGAQD